MELTESFTVPVSVDRLWEVLTDVERIAPCVPGFDLKEVSDPEYKGTMKVKVGAIGMSYDATITFLERDDAARRVVLSVVGRERRGPGGVKAKVTSSLTDNGAETMAEMVTDVQVTGRIAQFGRGILADVSSRITEQFVACLNERVLAKPQDSEEETRDDEPGKSSSAATMRAQPSREAEPLDLGSVAAIPVLKRALPVALLTAVVIFLVVRWLN
jgi:carbon monoxide dehydrogenase subunit G